MPLQDKAVKSIDSGPQDGLQALKGVPAIEREVPIKTTIPLRIEIRDVSSDQLIKLFEANNIPVSGDGIKIMQEVGVGKVQRQFQDPKSGIKSLKPISRRFDAEEFISAALVVGQAELLYSAVIRLGEGAVEREDYFRFSKLTTSPYLSISIKPKRDPSAPRPFSVILEFNPDLIPADHSSKQAAWDLVDSTLEIFDIEGSAIPTTFKINQRNGQYDTGLATLEGFISLNVADKDSYSGCKHKGVGHAGYNYKPPMITCENLTVRLAPQSIAISSPSNEESYALVSAFDQDQVDMLTNSGLIQATLEALWDAKLNSEEYFADLVLSSKKWQFEWNCTVPQLGSFDPRVLGNAKEFDPNLEEESEDDDQDDTFKDLGLENRPRAEFSLRSNTGPALYGRMGVQFDNSLAPVLGLSWGHSESVDSDLREKRWATVENILKSIRATSLNKIVAGIKREALDALGMFPNQSLLSANNVSIGLMSNANT